MGRIENNNFLLQLLNAEPNDQPYMIQQYGNFLHTYMTERW
jgi:hypothetical protein